MDDEPYAKCEGCGERVDPDTEDVVRAVEIVDLPGMGQAHDFVEGMPVVFHRRCYSPGSARYRAKES
jgi:hypothetical protein